MLGTPKDVPHYYSQDLSVTLLLYCKMAQINILLIWSGLNTILHACRRGSAAQLATLIEAGVDLKQRDKSSCSALHHAVLARSKSCVDF